MNAGVANTGTTRVGRVEIGNTQAVTATVDFDDIVVDLCTWTLELVSTEILCSSLLPDSSHPLEPSLGAA